MVDGGQTGIAAPSAAVSAGDDEDSSVLLLLVPVPLVVLLLVLLAADSARDESATTRMKRATRNAFGFIIVGAVACCFDPFALFFSTVYIGTTVVVLAVDRNEVLQSSNMFLFLFS